VTASPSEVSVCRPPYPGLLLAHRFDQDIHAGQEVIEAATGDGIASGINDNAGLQEIRRRHPTHRRIPNQIHVGVGLRLEAQDRK